MTKRDLIYEGKAKKLFQTEDPETILIEYLDQATALNGIRKDSVEGKAILNNRITALIFQLLELEGIHSHFIRTVSKNEQLVEAVSIIPLEVVIRNISAGSFSKRLDVKEGTKLTVPILEFYYKEDRLDDPIINDDHVKVLGIATDEEISVMKEASHHINQVLTRLFEEINICLVDFKLEFGRRKEGTILLADEITPDTCRLWDMETHDHLDKDVYRRNLGDIVPVYQEVLNRLEQKFN